MSTAAVEPKASPLAVFTQTRKWRKWTAVNDEALLAIVADEEAGEYRMLALGFLRAWGNPGDPRDEAVDPKTGKRLRKSDFARELGVSERTISRWGETLAAKNLLHVLDAGIYPVPDPSRPFPQAEAEAKNRHTPPEFGANYKKLKDEYFRAFPEKARAWDEARAKVRAYELEFLAYYRARTRAESAAECAGNEGSEAHTPPETPADSNGNGGALHAEPYIRNAREEIEDRDMAAPSSSSLSPPEAEPEPAAERETTTNDDDEGILLETLARYGTPDRDFARGLITRCRRNAPDATAEEIARVVQEKAPFKKMLGLGFFVTAVPPCFPLAKPAAQTPNPAPPVKTPYAIEEWEKLQWAVLNDPNSLEEDKRLARRLLGMDAQGAGS